MLTGLLGFAMLVGMLAASYSFATSGSFLIALLVYSVSGTCVMLAAMLYVALRGDLSEDAQMDRPEARPVRKAA